MKKFLRWTLRLSLALAALIVLLLIVSALALDPWLRSAAVKQIREKSGREVQIGRLSVGILKRSLLVENFVLMNTPEFGGGPMVRLPELRVELDPQAWREDRLRFKLIRMNLAEVNVVQDKSGHSNFDGLNEFLEPKKRDGQKKPFAGIDTLDLTLGAVRHTDLRVSAEPRTYQLGLNHEIITGIKDEQDAQAKLLPLLMKVSGNVFRGMISPAADKPKAGGE